MSRRILVVDDDLSIRETFENHLRRSGYEVKTAGSGEEALPILLTFKPAVVITDLRMPGMDGLDFLELARSELDDLDVLVITAHEEMASAINAMKLGAYDYLVKPLDLDEIDMLVERCFHEQTLRRRIQHLSKEASEPYGLDALLGRDPRMIEISKLIGVLACNRATVLIHGETGTGKELIARAIHFNSPHSSEPFITVNCTAIPETLLESELFGHLRGAFTDAVADRKGYFELVGSGTIFLDEIADTSLQFQAKLLRVLETRDYYPVGEEKPRRTNARVIATTHRPLEDLVRTGAFRDDLFFRLKVVEIDIPPLRERKGDIPLLAEHFLDLISEELHKDVRFISHGAMRHLTSYHWPGNVRELRNALTQAAVLSRGPELTAEDFSLETLGYPEVPAGSGPATDDTLDSVVRAHVRLILSRTGGNKRKTARVLGISRPRLDRMIEKYGLTVSNRDQDSNET